MKMETIFAFNSYTCVSDEVDQPMLAEIRCIFSFTNTGEQLMPIITSLSALFNSRILDPRDTLTYVHGMQAHGTLGAK